MSDEKPIAVGDQLAFYGSGWSNTLSIHKVTKITPSGRIVVGKYTLNPDLTVRGRRDAYSTMPYKGERITPEIQAKYTRQQRLSTISAAHFDIMTDEQLRRIVAAIEMGKDKDV